MDLTMTKDAYSFDSDHEEKYESVPINITESIPVTQPTPITIAKPMQITITKIKTKDFTNEFKIIKPVKKKPRKKIQTNKTCKICTRQFTNRHHLEEHTMFHDYMSFQCPFCPALFGTFRGMSRHKTPCGRLKVLEIKNSVAQENTHFINNGNDLIIQENGNDKPNFESLIKSYKLLTSMNGNSVGNNRNNNHYNQAVEQGEFNRNKVNDDVTEDYYTEFEDFIDEDDFEVPESSSEKFDPDYIDDENVDGDEDEDYENYTRFNDTNLKRPKRYKSGLKYTNLIKKVEKWKLLYSMQNENGYFCCPICSQTCSKSVEVLNHLRRHSDLTKVFEHYTLFFEQNDLPWSVNNDDHAFGGGNETATETVIHSEAEAGNSTNLKINMNIYKETNNRQPTVELDCIDIEKYNKTFRENTEDYEEGGYEEQEEYSIEYDDEDNDNDKDYKTSTDLHESIHGTKRHKRQRKQKCSTYRSKLWSKALGRVNTRNPHKCSLCNRVFIKPYGIAIHYTRTHNIQLDQLIDNNLLQQQNIKQPPQQQGIETFNPEADKDVSLQDEDCDSVIIEEIAELECNVNTILGCMVNDVEVLEELGWPKRDLVHLVTEILSMCGQEKSPPLSKSKISRLEWLRKNVALLMSICIKEKALEDYGWNKKPIGEVLKEMLNLEIEEMVK